MEDPLNITNIDQNNIVEDYTAFTVLIAATNRISLYWSGGAYSVIFIYIPKKQQIAVQQAYHSLRRDNAQNGYTYE